MERSSSLPGTATPTPDSVEQTTAIAGLEMIIMRFVYFRLDSTIIAKRNVPCDLPYVFIILPLLFDPWYFDVREIILAKTCLKKIRLLRYLLVIFFISPSFPLNSLIYVLKKKNLNNDEHVERRTFVSPRTRQF